MKNLKKKIECMKCEKNTITLEQLTEILEDFRQILLKSINK